MKSQRNYTLLDKCLIMIDQGVRTVLGTMQPAARKNPAATVAESQLTDPEKNKVIRLMRVNHAGEVSAQALYHGQAAVASSQALKHKLAQAAIEENDHLSWCEDRIRELQGHMSFLNPFWYIGSFCIGATAGLINDKWSLGFIAETENQVVKHLDKHLQALPHHDRKTTAILEQMRIDERQHATRAVRAGAVKLPYPARFMMQTMAKVMTETAYWV